MIVVCDLHAGGAEKVALQLVGGLVGRGFEFVLCPVKPGGVLAADFRKAGAEVTDPIACCRFDPVAPFRVARTIRRRGIQAIMLLDVTRNAMFHGFLGARLSGKDLLKICWCHSPLGGTAGDFTARLRRYAGAFGLDALVCTSRHERRKLIRTGLDRHRTVAIHNGIDLSRFEGAPPCELPLPAGKKIIVQVANFMPHKDHATLIAAAGRLAAARDDFHLLLVGRGTDSAKLQEGIAGAGLSGRATLAGYRDDVPGILVASHVFVLSTHYEAFSLAALEAMAAGLPLVVSDIPAFDEMFGHEREGLKVPCGDAESLAGAIGRLLDDVDLRQRFGAAGRRRVEQFSAEHMSLDFERLLRALERGG